MAISHNPEISNIIEDIKEEEDEEDYEDDDEEVEAFLEN